MPVESRPDFRLLEVKEFAALKLAAYSKVMCAHLVPSASFVFLRRLHLIDAGKVNGWSRCKDAPADAVICYPLLTAEKARKLFESEVLAGWGNPFYHSPKVSHFLCDEKILFGGRKVVLPYAAKLVKEGQEGNLSIDDFLVYPKRTAFHSTYFQEVRRGNLVLRVLTGLSSVAPEDPEYEAGIECATIA